MLYSKVEHYLLICFLRNRRHLRVFFRNYSGVILVPPAAAGEEKGKEARTPRAPARGLRPPAPLLSSYYESVYVWYTGVRNLFIR